MNTVLSITEARKNLPGIIKSIKSSPDTVYQITVHGDVVAEIKSPPVIRPGEAAAGILDVRKKIRGKRKGQKTAVSENVQEHLFGVGDAE